MRPDRRPARQGLIERVAHTRNYTINAAGIRPLAGLLILREKVIRPVLAGICKPRLARKNHARLKKVAKFPA